MNYPSDIPLPLHVFQERRARLKELTHACLRAMALRGLLIGIEWVGFWLFGAHSLLLDALSSCLDLLCSVILIACLFFAKIPPDEEHPFGHGRIEPIAGLLLGILLIQVGLYLAWQQLLELPSPGHSLAIDPRSAFFALAASIIMEGCYHLIKSYGKRHNSPAILSEAAHYRVDAMNSVVASLALLLGSLSSDYSVYFDRMGAFVIASMMIYLGFKAARSNFDQLVDRKPEESVFSKIRLAAQRVKGVKATEKINVQHYGPSAHVDIDVEVEPDMSVLEAHAISQHVRRAIQSEWPLVLDVTVHIEPYFEGDHT